MDTAPTAGYTVTVDYTATSTDDLEDSSQNAVENFAEQNVTN
ncbi:hypothetical protein TMU01_28950 [Tenuibacillus multivorans]|nr:hypothetical protein TMU01_28950 [Tenuibacillus multivorans]